MNLKELKNLKENKEEMISEFLFSVCRRNFKKEISKIKSYLNKNNITLEEALNEIHNHTFKLSKRYSKFLLNFDLNFIKKLLNI